MRETDNSIKKKDRRFIIIKDFKKYYFFPMGMITEYDNKKKEAHQKNLINIQNMRYIKCLI